MAIHDGAINAKDTGLGKTFDMYPWPALKLGFHRASPFTLRPKGAVLLLVAPGASRARIL